jgi:hypothetical protein
MSLSDKEENQAWSDREEYLETGANQNVHFEFEIKKGKMKVVFDGSIWIPGAEEWENLEVIQTVLVKHEEKYGLIFNDEVTLSRDADIDFFFKVYKDDIESLLDAGVYENDVELDGE